MKNKFLRWIGIGLLSYVLIGIALYFLQTLFLFHPVSLPSNYQFNFKVPFEEIKIPFGAADSIDLVKFLPSDTARKGVVLYFHGNKQNLERYAKFADRFTQNGYEVWMEDYPGYGKSKGKRTEKNLYQQALLIYALAAQRFPSDHIIIYGKSLGTGIAAYTASNRACKKLILETPYYSIPALFDCYAPIYPTSILSIYKIPTYQYLQNVQSPISIFHGTADGVIPYRSAIRLKAVLKNMDEFITIEKGTHHNLNDFPVFQQKLDSLLR
jgi:pimeloyl-ACP methyl ester carboxylesterase